MKIVMTYSVGDGCTWSSDVLHIFEYESAEALYSDFVDRLRQCKKAQDSYLDSIKPLQKLHAAAFDRVRHSGKAADQSKQEESFAALSLAIAGDPGQVFQFCGKEWELSDFYYAAHDEECEVLPDVSAFDEWFAIHGLWSGKKEE